MRLAFATALLLVSAASVAIADDTRRLDKSKHFTYVLPDAWTAISPPKVPHDVIVLPSEDGRNRSILVNDQPGSSPLAELKKKYERDMPKAFKGFQLISSDLIRLRDERPAFQIVHLNTTPGIPVRQINFVLEVGKRRYFVVGTVLKEDEDKFDKVVTEFVESMAAAED